MQPDEFKYHELRRTLWLNESPRTALEFSYRSARMYRIALEAILKGREALQTDDLSIAMLYGLFGENVDDVDIDHRRKLTDHFTRMEWSIGNLGSDLHKEALSVAMSACWYQHFPNYGPPMGVSPKTAEEMLEYYRRNLLELQEIVKHVLANYHWNARWTKELNERIEHSRVLEPIP